MNKEQQELELLAKRLYVAKIEQRNIDGQHYGQHVYQETTLEECRIELGLPPKKETQSEEKASNEDIPF